MITDLFPHVGSVADELCLIRSMHGDHNDHFEATLHMHTGSNGSAMPGIGAWVSYALGTQNTNLPSHIVFAENAPYAGAQVWDNHMLPAYHQGMRVTPGDEPIPYLKPQEDNPENLQDHELGLLDSLNQRHYQSRQGDSELAARMLSFKTANSLQKIAPELFDLSKESDKTLELYGVSRDDRQSFGWQTLVARRMAEAGVRFIELVDTGSHSNWDAHSRITRHEPSCPESRPANGCPDKRPQTTGHAGRYPDHLLHRVWAHGLREEGRTQPPQKRIFLLASRGRLSAGTSLRRD